MIITINDGETYLAFMKHIKNAEVEIDYYLDKADYEMAAEWSNERNERTMYLYEWLDERLPS